MKTTAPLSKVQYGLYVECVAHQGEACYNLPYLYVLDGTLDEERLCKAIETAVAAHPTLFTRIELDEQGDPQQAIDDTETFALNVEQGTLNIKSATFNDEPLIVPFDIYKDRLFHIRLLRDAEHFYFFLDIHHIIGDGTTLKVMLADLEKAYAGEALEPEAMTMAQVAIAEAELRKTAAFEEGKQWYAQNFDCSDCFTQLMPDLDEPVHSEASMVRTLSIDMSRVDDFCKDNGIFKSNFFTIAYSFLLAKYNNEQESLFTTIYNGRTDKRFLHSVGMTVKTLPVYAKFDNETKVLDYLKAGQDQMGGVRKHEAYAFSDVVNDLGLQSNSMFAWHGMMFADEQLCGKPMKTIRLCNSTLEASLYLKAFILNGKYQVKAEYNSNEYSKELISQYLESYEAVVEGFLTKEYLREVDITTTAQIALLDSFNDTDRPYDDTQTVVSLFRRQAKATPDAEAVVFKDHRYTYAEVDELSDRIAGYIVSKGLGVGDAVSIIIPRCEWMAIASLGILKAGCAYQPLDPSYPKERLNFMVKDAAARLLIADEELRDLVDEYDGEVLLTKDFANFPALTAEESSQLSTLNSQLSPSDRFILLYTSGSTGVPKGCQLTHGNLVCYCNWYWKYYDLKPEHNVAEYASYGFDVHQEGIYPPLTGGATVHIIPEELRLDLVALNEYLEREHITHTFMTTQVGYQFATNIENHSLLHMSVAGEKLASIAPPKGYQLHNGYGPTEATIIITVYPVTKKDRDVPIGKPLDNVKLYVVDQQGRRLPVGALGELWAAGPQVALGYLNRPDKNAEVFIPNPFVSLNSSLNSQLSSLNSKYARAYRTGDIVRYLPDGNIQFVGRKDGQVKIRGFRIELKEVEAVIREFPGIKDATVQAFDDDGGGKFIAAYIVSDQQIDIEALNNFILDQKPPYMVPAVTMQIDKIPLNQNQKVNKRALPKPEKKAAVVEDSNVPMNKLEQELHKMIAGIVNTKDFGVTTVLGYVGLTSISAIKLAVQLNRRYGINPDAQNLAKTYTLQDIENDITDFFLAGGTANQGETQAPAKLVKTSVPLSYAQIGVFVDCMNNPGSTVYNIPMKTCLPVQIDLEKLKDAVAAIIKSHPQLSIHFENGGSETMQVTNPDQEIAIPVSTMSEEDLETYKNDFVKPFNLEQGPLFRVEIVKTSQHVYLLTDFHHLVADGGSYDIFFRQLCSTLDGAPIEAETITYADFVTEEKQEEKGEKFAAAKTFFDQQLDGCDGATEILPDLPMPQEGGVINHVYSAIDMEQIELFCRDHHVTPAHLTLAATFYTLSRYTNNERPCITTISNGRSNLRIASTMGMFVNTLALSSQIGTQTVEEYIHETSENFLETLRHENYPFAQIATDYGLAPEIMFAYQMGIIDSYKCQGSILEIESLELNVPKFHIAIFIKEIEGKPNVSVEYDNGLYSQGIMQSLADAISHVTQAFISAPNEPLTNITLLDENSISLLDSFNQNDVPYDDTQTIVSLFRRQAKATPQNIAVVYQDKKYTYAEVDDISDRIARYICEKIGIKNEELRIGNEPVVSVLIPRCEWMAIASLGVLKAGCAYQPLDPSYPKERLNFMMQDANAKLLIADEKLRPIVDEYQGEVLLTRSIPRLSGEAASAKGGNHQQPIAPTPKSLFILLYTSGSTGVPKGCQLTHGNLVCFCHWYQRYYDLKPEHKVAAYASFGFDACMMDMYPALICGATLHIIPEEIRLDLVALNDYFEQNQITHSFMTTQVAYQFATSIENRSLLHLSSGGEKLASLTPPEGYHFYNGYGPTECTIFTTTYLVDKKIKDIPIGKPLDNMRLYVVDPQGHRLPIGAAGELWISGPQVSRGYLNRPEKTAEVYIGNPFTDDKKYARIYRSGDIVRYLQDGNIQFVGRKDGQVKIRGFRIELKEVESIIREFPGIKDATVQAFDEEGGNGKYIAAYIVSDEQIDIEALNNFILDQKPPYMVPAVTMQIDVIPLNQNQKVNKRALPKPEKKLSDESLDLRDIPMNVLEEELHELIAGIVNTKDFGVTTILGYVGLTSISSIKLAVQVNKRYGVTLDSKSLAKAGTLQSIENEILKGFMVQGSSPSQQPTANSQQPTANSKQPLSFAQQGVFTECQANPDAVQYNIPFALRFPKEIGEEQLANAVRKVVDAHPYILCHFVTNSDNEIIQEPIPDFVLEIPVKTMTADELEAYKKDFVRPFDLEHGPCVRFEIVKTDELTLLVDTHHLVSDGASVDLFLQQVCSVLDGSAVEKEDYTYYDFVRDEEITPETESFFEQQMAEVEEPTQLIPDVFVQNLPHIQKSVAVHTDIQTVKAFAQKNGITPAAVYLGACFITFGRYVCEDLVSIVTVSNGRSNIKVWNTMGMFVNTLPLVTTIDHHEKTVDFLLRVSQSFSDTIKHENYPFARIASRYDFHPQISYTYQIGVLNDYRTKYGAVEMEGLALELAKLPVAVYIVGTESDARIKVDYDTALFSEEMMLGLARSIDNVVRTLIESESLSQVSLTGKEEWKVLDSFNADWDLDFDKADTVVSVFRRNAKTQPDKVAAVFKDKAYTYRELDELTDHLAAKLYAHACQATGKSVLAEEVVSILLNRNENVFILPLAAVKAGLAYEPLDPSYPKERLNFMVKDAGACLLVAEESLLGLVDEYEGPTVTVEALYAEPNSQQPIANSQQPTANDLLIMLYTSGSTGLPKGCQIEHRNMVAYAHGVRNNFYRRDDRIAAYASFGFDVNMSDVFCTLLNGGTVYLIPEEIRMNLDALARYFDEAGITALLLTTQVGVQFLQNYPQLKTLRMLVMGGEKLPAVDPSRLSYTIINGYGPTENCCGVSLFPIRAWEPNIPIGKPMATIHGYVLDKTGHRLPAGAAGEYCLAGPQVSRGYLNRPDKTAEAYESSPFDEFRMYHTGDIVRYRQNGDVEFVGRKDGQVKIRGFRIETKEVEAVIRGFSGIRDVTVQAYDYEGGGKYLAAFVVSDNTVDMDALREFIKSQKPAYMVPAAIVQIEKIPLTVNQKVDKKALPEPRLQKAAYVAPEGKTEKDFCAIFEEILGVERVSAEDDFFEVGGNSILAMKVVVAAGKAGYSIVYNDVFQNTTPRAMAAFTAGEQPTAKSQQPTATASSTEIPEIGLDGYDYGAIHALLARNTLEAFRSGQQTPLSDVLLFGGTGYLGSHVLRELIACHDVRIWCFVRPGKDESGEQRLKDRFNDYFGSTLESQFASKVTVFEGDATDADSLLSFRAPAESMTVINCAASVKHFAKGDEIERTNVGSVKNITAWCEKNKARLVHISTGSITGSRKDNMPPVGYRFDEHRLFAGQELESNQYIHSKFMAERHIYEEILEHGLKAKIMRVGNLAPRAQDGEFQVNYTSNSYMNSLQAYQALGFIPYDALVKQTEFSPIDALAKAILALATTPEDCVCFMPMNTHRPLMGDIIRELSAIGNPIEGVENESFGQALNEALSSEAKSQSVSTLIAYKKNDNIQTIGLDGCNSDYTNRILERLGFFWPETGSAYIRQFIERLAEKGFFKC